MGVIWIMNYDCTTKTVAVLVRCVTDGLQFNLINEIKLEPYHDVNDTKTFLPGLGQRNDTGTNHQELLDIERLQ